VPAHPVTVRHARVTDHDRVAELTVAAYQPHQTPDYEPVLRDVAGRAAVTEVFVAERGDEVVGSVAFVATGKYGEVIREPGEVSFRMLAVAPAAQGSGAGRALVLACLDRARALGAVRVVISSQPTMTQAHALYATLGFTRLPERDWSPSPDVPLWAYALRL